MKNQFALIAFVISAFSQASFACTSYEAQFFGRIIAIKNSTLNGKSACFVRLGQFSRYQVSGVCPLDEATTSSLWIKDDGCSSVIGDVLSGVIAVLPDGSVKIN